MEKIDIRKMIREEIHNVVKEHKVDAETRQTFLLQIESIQKYITIIQDNWVKYEIEDNIKLIEDAFGNARVVQSTIEDILRTLEEVKKEHNSGWITGA